MDNVIGRSGLFSVHAAVEGAFEGSAVEHIQTQPIEDRSAGWARLVFEFLVTNEGKTIEVYAWNENDAGGETSRIRVVQRTPQVASPLEAVRSTMTESGPRP